ncbi:hypothetical protein BDY21DRAFT_216113 [Lineolata rhizophorae]|uniref:Uncharacterized protein n=1 Tax=Lineolata rhizophorae TaxID=578093 RepID=A0A6A6P2I1_9PEZI|nr:hypothetical protein BDY21DRAFT_216113 [Lineolata rhizophorae]
MSHYLKKSPKGIKSSSDAASASSSRLPGPADDAALEKKSSVPVGDDSRGRDPQPKDAGAPEVESVGERPLMLEEIRTLFSGAPRFYISKTRHKLQPQAAFQWDFGVNIRDLTDCLPPSHPAFSAATLRQHLRTPGSAENRRPHSVGYDIGVVEVPNMLSANGTEPGTVGFEYFLELPISDNLDPEEADRRNQEESDNGKNAELIRVNPEKLGVRYFDISMLTERLEELCELSQSLRQDGPFATILDKQSPSELYTILFGKLLTPPKFDSRTQDPTGLKVQIEALIRVLKLQGFWYDFSLVEWRIRLGQLLWSVQPLDDQYGESYPDEPDDREILLLQITLSCELLLRLDAVANLTSKEAESKLSLTQEEVKEFTNLRNRKVDYDLVLARRFVDNVKVSPTTIEPERLPVPSQSAFKGLFSFSGSEQEPLPEPKPDILIAPRHASLQLQGLLYFAEELRWPTLDILATRLSGKIIPKAKPELKPKSPNRPESQLLNPSSPSIYATPRSTPRSFASMRSSYFDAPPTRPGLSRQGTPRSLTLFSSSRASSNRNSAATQANIAPEDDDMMDVDIGGWLSRTFFTGLILPGECMAHFLISTLLENDSLAVAALGDSANLYGGFVMGQRSWWSKACVVGRVLAAMEDATECMGWISVPCVPSGSNVDGWIDLLPDLPVSSGSTKSGGKKRIEDRAGVEADADFLAGKDVGVAKPQDFVLVEDGPPIPDAGIRFDGLRIQISDAGLISEPSSPRVSSPDIAESQADSDDATSSPPPAADGVDGEDADEIDGGDNDDDGSVTRGRCIPFLAFSSPVPIGGTTGAELALRHDAYFISSFPCAMPRGKQARLLKSASSEPDLDAVAQPSGRPSSAAAGALTSLPSHPLHVEHVYRIVPAKAALAPSFALEDNDEAGEQKKNVLVLDARGSEALALLARAWCADRGVHAVVARVGRTCLACAIREARGCGVRVVVRIG